MAKILIVDDEENQRKTLGIGLRLEGYAISEAKDAEEGFDCLKREDVDLAIVDVMMPGMNGFEFAREVRLRHPHVRVVLTSAYHFTERQLERAEVGAVGFVEKPYAFDALVGFLRAKLLRVAHA